MPRLTARSLFAAEGLAVRRVTCDGVDGARAADEGSDGARIILVAAGRFAFQDGRGGGIASPAAGLFLPDGHTYRIRHVDGGDVCIAIQGDVARAAIGSGEVLRRIPVASYLRLRELTRRLRTGETSARLEVEEGLAHVLAGTPAATAAVTRRDRAVADVIAYELERDVDARLSLEHLAGVAGVSLFHACRVFRRVTGVSIHRYHQEVRLRHALAWLLETERPLSRIALDTGFANQGHLTNVFRRRFRTTPGAVRRSGRI